MSKETMTLRDMILSDREIRVTLEQKMVIPADPAYKRMNMQGGGWDGTFGYYAMNELGRDASVRTKLYKVDLDRWEVVAESGPFFFCHANDITYDSRHDRLLVTHCNVDPHMISSVDPKTLTLNEQLRIPVRHYALAYNPKRDQYVAGKSACYDISVMDSNFQELKVYECEDGFTKQGMECDDDFIYFFHTGCRYNHIWIYDWDGKHIRTVKVPMVGESENLFRRGNGFVAAFNASAGGDQFQGVIYEMTFSVDEES